MDGTKTEGGEYFDLAWDENGNMVDFDISVGDDTTLVYNWDCKLRSADKGSTSISLKYDPDGNRIFKDSSELGERKYIVDIAGVLPVILSQLNDSGGIVKTYIYANSQIIAQHTGDHEADRYFYLHDRLGSVRQIIDTSADVVKYYTYEPFGETIEDGGTFDNSFRFTGQYFDYEIDQYYLRARQYDPHIARFTTRDPAIA
jgi:RHS repeat-associated protein